MGRENWTSEWFFDRLVNNKSQKPIGIIYRNFEKERPKKFMTKHLTLPNLKMIKNIGIDVLA
mgnify:FL=1